MKWPIIATLTIAATPAFAEEAEHREVGAHVHGISELQIAIEDEHVAVDLTAPGMDIAGFEYEPESYEDHEAVEAAILKLGDPNSLFTMNSEAECYVTEVFAHRHGADGEHEHDEHDEEMHEGEEHEHDEHAEEEGDAHEHDESTHSEFHSKYEYTCHNIDALSSISLPYFDVFENAKEVDIELVSDDGAKRFEVQRENPIVELN